MDVGGIEYLVQMINNLMFFFDWFSIFFFLLLLPGSGFYKIHISDWDSFGFLRKRGNIAIEMHARCVC